MAIRTGTQIIADMQSVEDQFTTALSAPSRGNVNSVFSTLLILAQNAYDSRYTLQVNPVVDYNRGLERPGKEIQGLALDLAADIRLAVIDGPATARLPNVERVWARLRSGKWYNLKTLPFTT